MFDDFVAQLREPGRPCIQRIVLKENFLNIEHFLQYLDFFYDGVGRTKGYLPIPGDRTRTK